MLLNLQSARRSLSAFIKTHLSCLCTIVFLLITVVLPSSSLMRCGWSTSVVDYEYHRFRFERSYGMNVICMGSGGQFLHGLTREVEYLSDYCNDSVCKSAWHAARYSRSFLLIGRISSFVAAIILIITIRNPHIRSFSICSGIAAAGFGIAALIHAVRTPRVDEIYQSILDAAVIGDLKISTSVGLSSLIAMIFCFNCATVAAVAEQLLSRKVTIDESIKLKGGLHE